MYFAVYLVGALVGVGVLLGLYERLAAWQRMQRTLREPSGASRCPACHGNAVVVLGPDYYRCERCETAWGTGLAAVRRARGQEHLQQLTPADRIAFAIERLDRAEEHFYFAQQWVADGDGGFLADFLLGPGVLHQSPSGDQRNDALVACARECAVASEHVTEALDALGQTLEAPPVPHVDPTLMWADEFFNSSTVDRYAASQVWRVQANVEESLNAVRALRGQLRQQAAAIGAGRPVDG